MTGEKFRNLRIQAGMTQQNLADATQINIRQIQKIESGEIKIANISLKNGVVLAEILGYPINHFVSDEAMPIIDAYFDRKRKQRIKDAFEEREAIRRQEEWNAEQDRLDFIKWLNKEQEESGLTIDEIITKYDLSIDAEESDEDEQEQEFIRQEEFKEFIQQEAIKEAEHIKQLIEADSEVRNLKAPAEIYDNLMKQIDEYENEKARQK